MKTLFIRRTLVAVGLAIAVATGSAVRLQSQPAPTAVGDNTLPPDIDPASPTAQIIKLVQAGTDISVINAYVANSASLFNLDADQIVALKDAGVPTEVINAMMAHDKNLGAQVPAPAPTIGTVTAPNSAPPPADVPAPDAITDNGPDTAPPATPVTVQYFNNTLTPYGSWVQVNGYGRCWRPTVVVYNNNWSPYCDRGHWVYTDCGWYWNSDYSWGVTFHYGRWFRDAHAGWCWCPDTQWAPSWVVWRSSSDYCGWAPLPPFTVFTPGAGFFYRGVSVTADFNFGLGADCFVFVSPEHFCDRRPRSFCLDRPHVQDVFSHTTIINHFDVHNHIVVNNGIPVDHISAKAHRPIKPVRVGELADARREGWQGKVTVHQAPVRNYSMHNYQSPGSPGLNNNRTVQNYNSSGLNHGQNNNNQFNNNHVQTYTLPKSTAPAPNNNLNNNHTVPNNNQLKQHYNYYQSGPKNNRLDQNSSPPDQNNNHFGQNNNNLKPHPVPTPNTPAPVEHNPQWQMQQRAQQNEYHAHNGGSESRYNSKPQSTPVQTQPQGQGQGQSHNSGQDRQNH